MSSWNTPAKVSQASIDGFEEWKKEQNLAVSQRGVDADPAKEEEYNQFMLRQNLNAYICSQELDGYTECLQKHHLLRREEDSFSGSRIEVQTARRANEKLCGKTHRAYFKCMESQINQETILQNAAQHVNCIETRKELLQCMRDNSEREMQTREPQCMHLYRSLLRCGMNHLWNHYWKSIANVGEGDEFHLYELSRDDTKKQAFMRLSTFSEKDQEAYLQHRENLNMGYFLDPNTKSSQE